MNRGVMVTRGDPDIKELVLSAQSICHNENNNTVKQRLNPYFDPLATTYSSVCLKQKRNFFGLRDFYRYMQFFMLLVYFNKCELIPSPPLANPVCMRVLFMICWHI